MLKYITFLSFVFISFSTQHHNAVSDECKKDIIPVYKTDVPDEFQAEVILNSFLKDQIIDDMKFWFVASHFPYGNTTVWHKINLVTSTIDLNNFGINEKLVMVYYDSQNYCGIGGQCSTYLLRKIDGEWTKIEHWHEVKWEIVYLNSCNDKLLYILLNKGNDFGAPGPDHGRVIRINIS